MSVIAASMPKPVYPGLVSRCNLPMCDLVLTSISWTYIIYHMSMSHEYAKFLKFHCVSMCDVSSASSILLSNLWCTVLVCPYGLCISTQWSEMHSSGSIDRQCKSITTHEEMPKCGPDDDIAFTLSILGAGFSCKPWPQHTLSPAVFQTNLSATCLQISTTSTSSLICGWVQVKVMQWATCGFGSLVCYTNAIPWFYVSVSGSGSGLGIGSLCIQRLRSSAMSAGHFLLWTPASKSLSQRWQMRRPG